MDLILARGAGIASGIVAISGRMNLTHCLVWTMWPLRVLTVIGQHLAALSYVRPGHDL